MPIELYDTLGVTQDASKDDIKRAYKKLALKYHPDKLGDNASEEEKNKFVKIQEAYEILSDDTKRSQYDQFGIINDADHVNFNSMETMFDMLFREHQMYQKQKKQISPIVINVELTLSEVITGVKKNILFEREVFVNIDSNRITSPKGIVFNCEKCHGVGLITISQGNSMIMMHQQVKCDACQGKGYVNSTPSKYKFARRSCKFDYNFPIGIRNRDIITIPHIGNINPLNIDENGDVVITVSYKLEATLPKKNHISVDIHGNIFYTATVSVLECLTGTVIQVEHPNNNTYNVKTGKICQGSRKVVRKLGLPQKHGEQIVQTDLVILFDIVFPIISVEQEKLLIENFEEFYHQSSRELDINDINFDFSDGKDDLN